MGRSAAVNSLLVSCFIHFGFRSVVFLGSEIADVVNCRNGVVVERFKVGDFWLGFESIKGLFADKAKE